MIGQDEKLNDDIPVTFELPPKVKEYYTTLRDRLLLSYQGLMEPPRLISVTSSAPGEGVSTVAIHLAMTLSQHGGVLLVDGNLESPSTWDSFQEKIPKELVWDGAVRPFMPLADNLDLLITARLEGEERSRFESPHTLSELLADYRQRYQYVVFDTPPVVEGGSALRLGSLVDGVLIVVEAEKTHYEAVQRAKEQLRQVKATVLGVVMNKRRFPVPKTMYGK